MRDDLELSPVRASVEREERLLAGPDHERLNGGGRTRTCLGREGEIGAKRQRAFRKSVRRARGVDGDEWRRRRDGHGAAPLREEHAHLFPPSLPDLRPRVVMGEDLVVRPPGERLSVGAVLAHPDAVAPPPSRDDEDGLTVRGRRKLSGRRGDGERKNGDDSSEKYAHEGTQVSSAELVLCVLDRKSPALSETAYFQADSSTGARALSGSHQSRLATYQATVSASPSSKPRAADQPSSSRIFVASRRYRRS